MNARTRLRAARWSSTVLATAVAVFLLVAGPSLWEEDRLAGACAGMLAVDEVRTLFPGVELKPITDRPRSFGADCVIGTPSVKGRDKVTLTVSVGPSSSMQTLDGQARALPLGHGWTGSFALDPTGFGDPSVTVLLGCRSGRHDGLLVTVTAGDRRTFESAGKRVALAAVATRTARQANRELRCGAGPGGRVTEVGLPVTDSDYEDFADANGTCGGLLDEWSADRLGVRTVLETAAGRALTERCVLGGWRGAQLYELSATYGPYAEELRDHGDFRYRVGSKDSGRARAMGVYWTEADCAGGQGTALYRLMPKMTDTYGRPSLPERHAELRSALDAFAKASAGRHGCSAPPAP